MADIDLIPRDYFALRQLRRRLRRLGLAVALIVIATLGARLWLGWRIAAEKPVVAALQQRDTAGTERRGRTLAMQARKAEVDAQAAALQALRRNTAWEAVFRAVDAAHRPDVWFESLAYAREVQVEAPAAPGAASPITPAAAASAPGRGALPALRHGFEIEGHAMAHVAITEFMRTLAAQPGIHGVRLAQTGLRRQAQLDVVDFKLVATIDSERKATP